MKKYKINKNKLKRNIFIIILLILLFAYFKIIDIKTNENLAKYNDFVEYAKQKNILLTQENYNEFLKIEK